MSLETAAALIGIFTFIGGLIAWYKGAVQREYASQRDWEHVKNSQRQLVENLNFIFKELEEKIDELRKEHDNRFDKIDNQCIEIKGQLVETKSMFYASLGLKKRRSDDSGDLS